MPQVLNPTKNRIVLSEKESPETTIGGIIIPDQYRKVPQIAVVEEVGPDAAEDFEKGDEVLYAKYAGTEVELEGRNYIVLDADDILATVVQEFEGVGEVVHLKAHDPEEVS